MDRDLPRDRARLAATPPYDRERERATLLSNKHATPPSLSSEHRHSKKTKSRGHHRGETRCTCHSKSRISTGTRQLIAAICVASASAFAPANLTELKSAKTTCLNEAPSGNCPRSEAKKGKIGTWDVSQVTSLSQAFYSASRFNQDISAWDVSQVRGMGSMLTGATSFNQTPWCTPSWGASPFSKKGYNLECDHTICEA